MFCGKATGGRFTSAGWTEGPQPRDFSGLAVCAIFNHWSVGDFRLETPCGFLVPLFQSWTDTRRMTRKSLRWSTCGLGAVRDQIGCLRGWAKEMLSSTCPRLPPAPFRGTEVLPSVHSPISRTFEPRQARNCQRGVRPLPLLVSGNKPSTYHRIGCSARPKSPTKTSARLLQSSRCHV